jgi:hypothetical protein
MPSISKKDKSSNVLTRVYFNTTKVSKSKTHELTQFTEEYPTGGADYKNSFFSLRSSILLLPKLDGNIRYFGGPQNSHYGFLMFSGLREKDTSTTAISKTIAST